MTAVESPAVPLTLTIAEASKLVNVSESKLHELARTTGEVVAGLPILCFGATKSCRRINREHLLDYVHGRWTPGTPWTSKTGDR